MTETTGKHVLLVDDEDAARELIAECLGDAGCRVSQAGDGAEALRHLRRAGKEDWHLVMTDIRMPGVDGLELIERLSREHPDLPVLVMTGHGDKDLVVSLLRAGVDEYVDKPCGPETLLPVVRRMLSGEAGAGPRRELARLRQEMGELVHQEAGRQQQQVLEWLRGGIRHRFNQPLTVLHANVGLLKSAYRPEAAEERYRELVPDCLASLEDAAFCISGLVTLLSNLKEVKTQAYVGQDRILDLEASATEETR
jgi:DNA-binding response OmpR family regulator